MLLAAGPARADKVVHKEQTLYRTVWVEDDADGTRCMRFSRRQSSLYQTCIDPAAPDHLVLPYTQMLMTALYLKPAPARVLIVGLGGGVLPMALAKLLPEAEIDVVELDPAVIRIAEEYFGFRSGPRVHVTTEDGRVFVKRAMRGGAAYDLVMLDAFDHQYIPEHLETREFLQEVGHILAPDGVLAANTFAHNRLYDSESVTYEQVFGPFFNLVDSDDKDSNRVILVKHDGRPTRDSVAKTAATLADRLAVFDMDTDELLATFSTEQNWRTDARVLTDQYAPANLLNLSK
jgi:spermidine synthase